MTSRSGVCQIDHPMLCEIVAKIDRKGQITGRFILIFGTNVYKTKEGSFV